MKKIYSLILCCLCFTSYSEAQNWLPINPLKDFSLKFSGQARMTTFYYPNAIYIQNLEHDEIWDHTDIFDHDYEVGNKRFRVINPTLGVGLEIPLVSSLKSEIGLEANIEIGYGLRSLSRYPEMAGFNTSAPFFFYYRRYGVVGTRTFLLGYTFRNYHSKYGQLSAAYSINMDDNNSMRFYFNLMRHKKYLQLSNGDLELGLAISDFGISYIYHLNISKN